jgi:phage gp36-like protein
VPYCRRFVPLSQVNVQEAAKLLTALGDCIQAIEAYLAAAERSTLDNLPAVLPAKSQAGSAPRS